MSETVPSVPLSRSAVAVAAKKHLQSSPATPALNVLDGIERVEGNPWVIRSRKPGTHTADIAGCRAAGPGRSRPSSRRRGMHPGRPARVSPRGSPPRSRADRPVDRPDSRQPRGTRNHQAPLIVEFLDDRTGATRARVETGRLPVSLRDRQDARGSGDARSLEERVGAIISIPRTCARIASRDVCREQRSPLSR